MTMITDTINSQLVTARRRYEMVQELQRLLHNVNDLEDLKKVVSLLVANAILYVEPQNGEAHQVAIMELLSAVNNELRGGRERELEQIINRAIDDRLESPKKPTLERIPGTTSTILSDVEAKLRNELFANNGHGAHPVLIGTVARAMLYRLAHYRFPAKHKTMTECLEDLILEEWRSVTGASCSPNHQEAVDSITGDLENSDARAGGDPA